MCRIAGLNYPLNSTSSVLRKNITAMTDIMEHGGPDDSGIYLDKTNAVALGNRRLSIIDLSDKGHQPMENEVGNLFITYNGEVYNFSELRDDLVNLGFSFRSNTDTEVVLKAYEMWGEDSFSKLNGMFSYCIYDRDKELIYLVRDQAGIKPLYYSFVDDNLTFASEIKSFYVTNQNWEKSEDWQIYLLLFGHLPEPYTILKDVYMLPKGTYLKFDLKNRSYSISNYSKYEFASEIRDADAAVRGVKKILTESVQRQLVSDAPLGVFLSGGLDSSLLSLISSKFLGSELRTLSIIFNENKFSEEKYQKIITDKIRSNHIAYKVTENDFINNLEYIFKSMDQPTTDGINSYFISKCAKETELKVVLSGIGADELFGGYPSFGRINKIWKFKRLNKYLRNIFSLFDLSENQYLKKISFLSIPNPLSYYLLFRGLFSINSVSKILDIKKTRILEAIEKIYIENNYQSSSKEFVSKLESDLYMKNQLLRDTDFMSMWQSVEVRVPFLDNKFVNFVNSINHKIRFKDSDPKHLLKKAFSDLIPADIVNRKKAGFTFPFQIWMKNNIDLLIEISQLKRNRYINEIIKNFRSGNLHWSRFWALVVMNQKSI